VLTGFSAFRENVRGDPDFAASAQIAVQIRAKNRGTHVELKRGLATIRVFSE
jgi:hypothetical protein